MRVNDVLGHKAMENAFQSDDGCVALCTPSQPASVFSSWLMSGHFLSSGTFSLQIVFESKHHLILSPPSPPSLSLSPLSPPSPLSLSLSLSLSRIYTHGQGYQRPSLRRTQLSGIKVQTRDNLTLVFPSIQLGQYQP